MIMIIGLVAVIVAVFGHPTQTVAAAVIVTALGALADGSSPVTREALKLLTRLLPSLGGSVVEHVTTSDEQMVRLDQSPDHGIETQENGTLSGWTPNSME